ncbi:MAG: acyl-CoA reductase [Bacteroidota bacterium]
MEEIENLVELGKRLTQSQQLQEVINKVERKNPWFVKAFVQQAIDALVTEMLNAEKLNDWLNKYELKEKSKTIGLIFAGNIPLVGFHDFLCCYLTGCNIKIKLSSKDDELFSFVLKALAEIDPAVNRKVQLTETLKDFDAVIATGSNNTNRYFEYYFRGYPKILRRNRNSVAILNGEETGEEMEKLADDIFLYFGFGCRNVSKLYVPVGYNITQLFPHFEKKYKWLHEHNKFMNNYDYHRTILMLNKTPHLSNEFIMLVESTSIAASIATLNYEFWHDDRVMNTLLKQDAERIQCVSSKEPARWNLPCSVYLGQTQHPGLSDYADGIDTMAFLLNL